MLEKPKLFLNSKEFWITVILFFFLFIIRLGLIYNYYNKFIAKPFYYTTVDVLQQYEKHKHGKTYTVLRVYAPSLNLNFFTTTYRVDNLLDKKVRLKLFPSKRISFFDYLGTGYISSEINSISPKITNLKSILSQKIANQHTKSTIIEFYQAIFLAKPLSKKLRKQVSILGVSHLIALSGFHLAILSGILFFLIRPIYSIVQQRYFPYRFDLIDVGLIVLLILGWYVWFVGSPASLMRSYMMMVVGLVVAIMGIELISFEFLITIVMILLLLIPKMLFSLAFWFSVLGVFYIFLLIKRFSNVNKIWMTLIISFGIFVLMLPLIHLIFPTVTSLQLYSPFLSLGFTLFYPLAIGLHIIGIGGVFDSWLINLFGLSSQTTNILVPWYYGVGYIFLSIGAIFSKWAFYLLFLIAFLFMLYIFIML
ncbi:MAG TPA: ComEC/Rec2 family competence protein [Campylobacterales bacterium]|nr:ComEC/Rec2 family competence protein [Campylobacterales bacterium]